MKTKTSRFCKLLKICNLFSICNLIVNNTNTLLIKTEVNLRNKVSENYA